MEFTPDQLLHVYNQGNNRQLIFFRTENYLHFLRLSRKYVNPYCHMIAYCLMPNHFHFLLLTTEKSGPLLKVGGLMLPQLLNGIRKLQTTYAQAINRTELRSGSLFRQKAKFVSAAAEDDGYEYKIIQYIHNNPVRASLVQKATDWPYSSASDYAGLRQGTFCNLEEGRKLNP